MESMNMFGLLIALFSGGTGDLLDYAPTDAYWKAKGTTVTLVQLVAELKDEPPADASGLIKALGAGSFAEREQAGNALLKRGTAVLPQLEKAAADPDPEVANRATRLARQLRTQGKALAVRRLMAIRALGEMKQADALPPLKAMLDSKEQFVADYAARAIAAIDGKPAPAAPSRRAGLAADLSLLPAKCGLIAQFRFPPATPDAIAKLIKDAPIAGGENRAESLAWLNAGIIALADQVGNVRIDGVTIGLSDSMGPDKGYAVIIVHGQYDSAAMAELVRGRAAAADKAPARVEGVEVFAGGDMGTGSAIAFPSDDRAVLFTAGAPERLPTAEVLAAIKKPAAAAHPLLVQAEFAPLMAEVDRAGDAARTWVACRVGESYREAKFLKAFDTVTMIAVKEKDGTAVRFAGRGKDAATVAAEVKDLNQGLEFVREQSAEMVRQVPGLKPVADLVKSLKCEATGKDAAMTGRFDGEPAALFAVPLMGLVASREGVVQEAPPAAVVKPEKK